MRHWASPRTIPRSSRSLSRALAYSSSVAVSGNVSRYCLAFRYDLTAVLNLRCHCSSKLAWVRSLPAISSLLNDVAVIDRGLYGWVIDPVLDRPLQREHEPGNLYWAGCGEGLPLMVVPRLIVTVNNE